MGTLWFRIAVSIFCGNTFFKFCDTVYEKKKLIEISW